MACDSFRCFVLLPPIGEAKNELIYGVANGFLDAKFQSTSKNEDSSLQNCVMLSVAPSRLRSKNRFFVYVRVVLAKLLKRTAKEQVHILLKSKAPLDFGILALFAGLFLE